VNAAQSATIANNIINANTPGYSREIADVVDNPHGGADVASIAGEANGAPLDQVNSSTSGSASRSDAYVIPPANVASPDNLTPALGDVYQTSNASSNGQVGNAGTGGLGSPDSSSLEQSTVDLATELTSMVEAQSSYEANSKVFQTGSDILLILNNLKA
jgi:flagellar hook protein FlgE